MSDRLDGGGTARCHDPVQYPVHHVLPRDARIAVFVEVEPERPLIEAQLGWLARHDQRG